MSAEPPPLRGEEATFFEEAAEGRLAYQRCLDCGAVVFYQRVVCPSCMSDRIEGATSGGRGVVYSHTTVCRPGHPWFTEEEVPYVVALVELDEGFRVLANVRGCPPENVVIGMQVEVRFEQLEPGFGVPTFVPAEGGPG